MKQSTRLRILDHFRKHQTGSATDLSHFFGMTGANIRHHLGILESNDLIEVIGSRKEGRGRPKNIYGLSRRVQGDGLDRLAGAILDIWLDGVSDERREPELKLLAENLAGDFDTGDSIIKNLVRTIERLNVMHYQARWEANPSGSRIILGHCPYAAIITGHPELCKMDSFLLESMLGPSIEQSVKLQLNDKGLPFCVFLKVEK
jgi:predicted ArsR family transcriptional regulator